MVTSLNKAASWLCVNALVITHGTLATAEGTPKPNSSSLDVVSIASETDSTRTTSNPTAEPADWGGSLCEEAHAAGQIARRQKRLLESRKQFQTCSLLHCHDEIRRDCIKWYEEVERSIPTVVFVVLAGDTELFDFSVLWQREILATGLDSTAIELDPGIYELHIEAPQQVPTTQQVRVREGEKNRIIRISLPGPVAARSKEPQVRNSEVIMATHLSGESRKEGNLIRDYFTAGLAVASVLSVGAAMGFFWSAFSKVETANNPESGCRPACPEETMRPIRQHLLAADIFLATSVVTGGGALSLWLTRPSEPDSGENSSSPRSAARLGRGLTLGLRGSW